MRNDANLFWVCHVKLFHKLDILPLESRFKRPFPRKNLKQQKQMSFLSCVLFGPCWIASTGLALPIKTCTVVLTWHCIKPCWENENRGYTNVAPLTADPPKAYMVAHFLDIIPLRSMSRTTHSPERPAVGSTFPECYVFFFLTRGTAYMAASVQP